MVSRVWSLLLIIFIFVGCQAPMGGYLKDNNWNMDYRYNSYQVEFISDPPGAVIEWNNDYIGKTPCIKIVTGDISNWESIKVVATPIQDGQYVQRKELSNPLLKKVYFNMNLIPTNNNYNININDSKN